MKHPLKRLGWAAPALLALACAPHAAASSALPAGINGFGDPGGFTLNGNSGGPDNQSAATHGVPYIGGGTLTLTTSKGMAEPGTFYGSENTSAYYNARKYIGSFYASFVYHYNGSNHQSFGPGNGFGFILQNDPRGLTALGTTGIGNGQQGDGGTIMPSAEVEFGLFTGFGQNAGTQLAFNGDPGTGGTFLDPSPVKLYGANAARDNFTPSDPVSVILTYNGTTLSETLTDTVTGATYHTAYNTDLPAAVGSAYAYVGFTGGTGAAVADQSVSNFVFSNTVPAMPVNTGPKITVTGSVLYVNQLNNGTEQVDVAVTTTDSSPVAADKLQLTGVTLNSGAPLPVSQGSGSPVPTTPNLLATYQTNTFLFVVPAGTHSAALKVGGQYVNPMTNGTGVFSGSVRLSGF